MSKVLLKEYKNGNKLWGIRTECAKCGGTGKVIWSYADHVCFDCGGKGWYFEEEREYTPENLAKIEKKKAKKQAEIEAEQSKKEAERAEFEAQHKAMQEALEAKRRGHYYGEVGKKVEIDVTFTGYSSFETNFGTMIIYRFDTDDGAHLIWKTGTILGGYETVIDNGDRLTIRATIKEHKEYNGIEQTELQRVKLLAGGTFRKDYVAEYGEDAVVVG